MMRRTGDDLLDHISHYVDGVEAAATRSADYLIDKARGLRDAKVEDLDDAISELCHAIESERDEVLGALPCAHGIVDFVEEVSGAAVDMPTEAARLLHEVEGRLMGEAPEVVLAWLRSALAAVARCDEPDEVPLAVEHALGSGVYAPTFAPPIDPKALAPLPLGVAS